MTFASRRVQSIGAIKQLPEAVEIQLRQFEVLVAQFERVHFRARVLH